MPSKIVNSREHLTWCKQAVPQPGVSDTPQKAKAFFLIVLPEGNIFHVSKKAGMNPDKFQSAAKIRAFMETKRFVPEDIPIPAKPKIVTGKIWVSADKKFNIFIKKKVNGGGKSHLKQVDFKSVKLPKFDKMVYHKALPGDPGRENAGAKEVELKTKVKKAQSAGRTRFRLDVPALKSGLKLMVKIQEASKGLPRNGTGDRDAYDELLRQYSKYLPYAEACDAAYNQSEKSRKKFESKGVKPLSPTRVKARIAKLNSLIDSIDARNLYDETQAGIAAAKEDGKRQRRAGITGTKADRQRGNEAVKIEKLTKTMVLIENDLLKAAMAQTSTSALQWNPSAATGMYTISMAVSKRIWDYVDSDPLLLAKLTDAASVAYKQMLAEVCDLVQDTDAKLVAELAALTGDPNQVSKTEKMVKKALSGLQKKVQALNDEETSEAQASVGAVFNGFMADRGEVTAHRLKCAAHITLNTGCLFYDAALMGESIGEMVASAGASSPSSIAGLVIAAWALGKDYAGLSKEIAEWCESTEMAQVVARERMKECVENYTGLSNEDKIALQTAASAGEFAAGVQLLSTIGETEHCVELVEVKLKGLDQRSHKYARSIAKALKKTETAKARLSKFDPSSISPEASGAKGATKTAKRVAKQLQRYERLLTNKIALISKLQDESTKGARWCEESKETLKKLKQPGHDAFATALEVSGKLAMAGLGLVSVAGWAEAGKELGKVAAKEAADFGIDMVTDWGVKANQMKM